MCSNDNTDKEMIDLLKRMVETLERENKLLTMLVNKK